ncbi:MAG TPA: YecR family lipoprotein [Pseudomonadales bacterium]|nr:YecR family lipoprotein [Pseudomonadales bacterium]
MRFFILWIAAILLSGCVTEKHYTLTETDTKNGTVRFSCNFTMFERPEVAADPPLHVLAWQECRKLGYPLVKVEPKQETLCLEKSSNGDYCVNTLVSRIYQCASDTSGER